MRILVTESEGMSDRAISTLREVGHVELADLDRDGLMQAVSSTDVLWVRLRHQIDAEVLRAAPRLRMIASPTTGLDHIDLEAANSAGIEVVSLRGAQALLADIRATSELTLALVLALLRHVPAASADVNVGRWERDRFKGRELFRSTVGIVGYGRLGKIVARYLAALGANVIACDPNGIADAAVEEATFDELLRRADVVTLHVPLSEATRNLIGRRELSAMKPGSVLINTSRGEIVDEAALLDALTTSHLAGAALDVISGERSGGMSSHPLVRYAADHPNLLITPHIGGCTYESMARTEEYVANLIREKLPND